MIPRSALALAVAGLLSCATAASAAPPQIVDAPDDALAGRAGLDIVSVHFALGRAPSRFAALRDTLEVKMTLAGAPETVAGIRYVVNAATARCGDLTLTAYSTDAGFEGSAVAACGEAAAQPALKIGPRTIHWSIPLAQLSPTIVVGSTMRQFDAVSDLGEPLFGAVGTGSAAHQLGAAREDPTHGKLVFDYARGDGSWTIR